MISSGQEFCSGALYLRSSYTELRRAAGSQSLEQLKVALEGWAVDEIDNHIVTEVNGGSGGKNPLHMAAWRGCLENVKYLIESVGCDVNRIAVGPYCYGKTAIFFALTQCREDVIEYLLEKKASVRIINNKGQSVVSIAASHVSNSLFQKILQYEKDQETIAWKNFRLTHSDGFHYGDLDLRFLDRPLRDTDVVCQWVVNPTTKQTRKGGFQKLNGNVIPKERFQSKLVQKKSEKKKQQQLQRTLESNNEIPCLSFDSFSKGSLDEAWEKFHDYVRMQKQEASAEQLITIIRINDMQKTEWIPKTAIKLRQIITTEDIVSEIHAFAVMQCQSDRETKLLNKLIYSAIDSSQTIQNHYKQKLKLSSSSSISRGSSTSFNNELWETASAIVQHLQISQLERAGIDSLTLPEAPILVDTVPCLDSLMKVVRHQKLVAIDTEWYDDENLSLLQVAFDNKAYVVDLMITKKNIDADDYFNKCRQFIQNLFQEKIILGFAIHNDMKKLEHFVTCSPNNSMRSDHNCINRHQILDYQQLFNTMAQLPGLAACATMFTLVPLCKEQQCSDWSQRPLTQKQIHYAALDAAILLYLLAEKDRRYSQIRPWNLEL